MNQWLVREDQAENDPVLLLHLDLAGSDGVLLERALATAATFIAHAHNDRGRIRVSLSGPGMEQIVVDYQQASRLLADLDVGAAIPEIVSGSVVISTRENPGCQLAHCWLSPAEWAQYCDLPRLRQRMIAAGGMR